MELPFHLTHIPDNVRPRFFLVAGLAVIGFWFAHKTGMGGAFAHRYSERARQIIVEGNGDRQRP